MTKRTAEYRTRNIEYRKNEDRRPENGIAVGIGIGIDFERDSDTDTEEL
jgi:hypothetical protein